MQMMPVNVVVQREQAVSYYIIENAQELYHINNLDPKLYGAKSLAIIWLF